VGGPQGAWNGLTEDNEDAFEYMFATTGDSSWLPNSSREFKTIFPSLCQTLPHLRISFKCHTRRFHTLSNTPSQPTYVLGNNFTNICPTF
jgi:hypothetical protein